MCAILQELTVTHVISVDLLFNEHWMCSSMNNCVVELLTISDNLFHKGVNITGTPIGFYGGGAQPWTGMGLDLQISLCRNDINSSYV